jgi:hypothetical protein
MAIGLEWAHGRAMRVPTRSALLFENGLPDVPALLVEPHRNPGGIWRIKFSYETNEPLSMSAAQASTMSAALHEIGEAELADEIDAALKTALRYSSM